MGRLRKKCDDVELLSGMEGRRKAQREKNVSYSTSLSSSTFYFYSQIFAVSNFPHLLCFEKVALSLEVRDNTPTPLGPCSTIFISYKYILQSWAPCREGEKVEEEEKEKEKEEEEEENKE